MTTTRPTPTADMERIADLCLDTCLAVKPDEKVLIVTDDQTWDDARALSRAATRLGSEAITILLPLRDRYATQPPPSVVAAMVASNVVVLALDHELSVPFSHSVGCREALAAGARMGLFWSTIDTAKVAASDITELAAVTERLAEALRLTQVVHVSGASGTDVRVPIGGRRVTPFHSALTRPGSICTIPYYAEAAVAPVEGGTEGTIVVDTYMHWLGKINEPLRLRVAAGRVVEITGGPQARQLRDIVAGADANATNIAELGIGTCRIGQVRGTSQDKALIGTAHLGIGHNHSLGGTVVSNIHLDGVFRDATIELDGRPVMHSGQLLL